MNRPEIVCLCGSTRFYEAFQQANYEETMQGRIVLSVGFFGHTMTQIHGESVGCTPAQKEALDELHRHKIDLSTEVLILNVGGYIGESTKSELAYALACHKRVRFLDWDQGEAYMLLRMFELGDIGSALIRRGRLSFNPSAPL
jgi:hypothetical protein